MAETNEKTKTNNKIYRYPKVEWLGGVCAGIAYRFKIQTWIIRLIWAALFFLYGFGLGLYILLWIFMPEAETPADYKEVCD